jgi:hypothetical protein
MKLYAERDAMKLGQYYSRHVSAMTGEDLHSKSDIAAELAWRDREIDRLKAELDSTRRCLDLEKERKEAAQFAEKIAIEKMKEAKAKVFECFNNDECWIFQDDGEDYPESLFCPVVMSADQFRAFMKCRDEVERFRGGIVSAVWIKPDDLRKAMIAVAGERAEVAPEKEGDFTVPLYTYPAPAISESDQHALKWLVDQADAGELFDGIKGVRPYQSVMLQTAIGVLSDLLSCAKAATAVPDDGLIQDALCDSHYSAGLKAGFQMGQFDDNDGLAKALQTRAGAAQVINEMRAANRENEQ